MFKLFKNKKNTLEIKSPVDGQTISIEAVEDEVFSQKMMGEGVAVIPSDDIVVAPIEGKVVMIMEHTKHAIGIEHSSGLQILIHIGLDTVNLEGEGFEILTSLNEVVTLKTPLIKFDRDYLASKNISDLVMVVITDPSFFKPIQFVTDTKVIGGKDSVVILQK